MTWPTKSSGRSPPTTIARDGAWLTAAIGREELDADDLDTSLREHGIASVDEVALAVLEPDGSISVVPRDRQRAMNRRRKVRIVTHR